MKIAVIGGGKLGTSITKALVGGGHEITLLDTNNAVISRILNAFDVMAQNKDARNSKVLADMHIEEYDAIICCTTNDENNIFIASMAKQMGCHYSIARVRDPEHVAQLELIKANFKIDYLVNSDYSCAQEIFRYLSSKSGLSGNRFTIGKADILEFESNQLPNVIGKKLKEAASSFDGLLLAAISRNGKIIIPNGNTELLEGDSFFVTGLGTKVAAFRKKLKSSSKEDKMKKVMIGGGGKTGFYLAHMLTEDGVAVKIIEKDEKRCNYLAERLEKALVLNGNACDPTLLAEENLKNMDAFIAATGSDESNILLAILAQKNNVKDVIAKVSSNYYNSITDELDDTMTINPIDMCTSSILRKLTSGTSINFKKMIQGQAEFVEVLAEENMPITSDSLSNMDIPEGVIITTINRGKDVIIPTGSTQIMPGDKVVILALLTKVGELEALLSGTVHSM